MWIHYIYLYFPQLMAIWVVSTFYLLWIMLLWTFVYKIFCGHKFPFLLGVHIPGSGIAELCGNSTFNNLRNCQTVFQKGCAVLHSQQQCMRVPLLHIFPNTLLSVFFISAILVDVKWDFVVVLICISLMTNDFEHILLLVGHLCIFFGEISIQIVLPVLNWVICLFIIEL